jgi:uncharacterized phage protein gp47/JayE
MPFQYPTLAELRDRIRRDFNARIPGADALLRVSNLRVVADVFAGLVTRHYQYQVWLSRQLFPDTAEQPFLDRWAAIWGVTRREAVAAVGSVAVTGAAGAVVPAGTEWQRGDRVRYAAVEGATLAADGTATAAVLATEPGELGNAAAGTSLTTTASVPGLAWEALVAPPGCVGGADAETDEELRFRLLARIQAPPHGGAASDYILWTLEIPGVDRAWVYPLEGGGGTVVVRFTMLPTIRPPDGIPTPADVAVVAAHLETVRPVTATVLVYAPDPFPIDVTIVALTPDTPAIREAVQTELLELFRREEMMPGGVVHVSWIWEAVSLASGERHHTIRVPAGDLPMTPNALPVLGVVTYVAF